MKITDLPADTLTAIPHLVEKLRDVELPNPVGWNVMVLQFVRPDKVGSLLMPETVKREDIHQGRMGVVLAMGADAYSDKTRFKEPWCKPGSWILWPPVEAAAARVAYGQGITLAFINDDRVMATGFDPLRAVSNG